MKGCWERKARSLTHRVRLDLAVDVGEIVSPEPDLDLKEKEDRRFPQAFESL